MSPSKIDAQLHQTSRAFPFCDQTIKLPLGVPAVRFRSITSILGIPGSGFQHLASYPEQSNKIFSLFSYQWFRLGEIFRYGFVHEVGHWFLHMLTEVIED